MDEKMQVLNISNSSSFFSFYYFFFSAIVLLSILFSFYCFFFFAIVLPTLFSFYCFFFAIVLPALFSFYHSQCSYLTCRNFVRRTNKFDKIKFLILEVLRVWLEEELKWYFTAMCLDKYVLD